MSGGGASSAIAPINFVIAGNLTVPQLVSLGNNLVGGTGLTVEPAAPMLSMLRSAYDYTNKDQIRLTKTLEGGQKIAYTISVSYSDGVTMFAISAELIEKMSGASAAANRASLIAKIAALSGVLSYSGGYRRRRSSRKSGRKSRKAKRRSSKKRSSRRSNRS